ncbi:hypothetical protein [Methanobrevibacter sp. DSM 116169]|uniref:hypothetical protein n=1 Tax=Methanobrevibacter sp. DSM 116169 TaxID=3242727 RepID=UPI0038FD3EA1
MVLLGSVLVALSLVFLFCILTFFASVASLLGFSSWSWWGCVLFEVVLLTYFSRLSINEVGN